MVYCLIGKVLTSTNHQKTIDTISYEYNKENQDYGLIVLNKETNTIHISSLKNIDVNLIYPNGNNLPFQIYFGGLDDKLNHSCVNQDKKLIECYLKSWQKKISIDLNPLYDIINKI